MKPSHVCKHLRTKQLYIPEEADKVFAQENGKFSHSSPCWCNRTLTVTGPDDKPAGVQICSPTRSCFEE